jgi:predicted ATPase
MVSRSQIRRRPAPSEHNLLLALTSIVGRARELERVGEILNRTRLVTLTGPGGVGKTRLALEIAWTRVGRPAGGVWLVDLTTVTDPSEVPEQVARVLGVQTPRGTSPREALLTYLAPRELFLVLDNCEHVITACAELVVDLLGVAADIRILATSRESLGVAGETVWRLEPLGAEDAYRLFVERARQRRPEFIADARAEATIADLCARVDRLPLGIELAAAGLGVMSPGEVLASIEARLHTPAPTGRLSPSRHRTVRAAVEWSYDLLDPTDRDAFLRLAVFAGEFDPPAAQAVAGMSLDVLARLVDKSLVAVGEGARGSTRYRLLETVRELAAELLDQSGEREDTRNRHLNHFLALADIARNEWLSTGRQRFINRLDDDYGNVRAALEWAAESEPCAGIRLLAGSRDLFFRFGQADGIRLGQRLLKDCSATNSHRAEALIAVGQLAASRGDTETARVTLAEAHEVCVGLEEPVLEAWVRFFQGLTEMLAGEVVAAHRHAEASREMHHALGLRIGEARSMAVLSGAVLAGGDLVRARGLAEEALAVYEAEDDGWGQGQSHTFLGGCADTAGDTAGATRHYRRAIELLRPSADATLLPVALLGQAAVIAQRDPAAAIRPWRQRPPCGLASEQRFHPSTASVWTAPANRPRPRSASEPHLCGRRARVYGSTMPSLWRLALPGSRGEFPRQASAAASSRSPSSLRVDSRTRKSRLACTYLSAPLRATCATPSRRSDSTIARSSPAGRTAKFSRQSAIPLMTVPLGASTLLPSRR